MGHAGNKGGDPGRAELAGPAPGRNLVVRGDTRESSKDRSADCQNRKKAHRGNKSSNSMRHCDLHAQTGPTEQVQRLSADCDQPLAVMSRASHVRGRGYNQKVVQV